MSDVYAARAASLRSIVDPGLTPEGGRWLSDTLSAMQRAPDLTALRVAFARAGRKLPAIPLGDLGVSSPADSGLEAWRPHWTARDHARAILLLTALGRSDPASHVHVVDKLLRTGDLGEQESLLRILGVLPDAARFVEVAIEACRTNAERVFAAIAGHNAYPAAHFPDPAFAQMVLKTIFLGLPTAGIEGLPERVTPELVRMLHDYAAERRAAGRPVPEDIDRITRMIP